MSAPIFKRIADATLRYLGIPPTLNPAPPVLVVRRSQASGVPTAAQEARDQPMVSLVADGSAGTVPDLRGMSAREAARRVVTLGMSARISGDGFVMAQDPLPGAPLEPGAICRIRLERSARRSQGAESP